MKKICLLLLILAATRATAQNKDHTISFDALGSLKLGMIQDEVEKLLNQKIKLTTNHLDTVGYINLDTAKIKYKNIPVQLEFEKHYYKPNVFHMRLIGIRASSPLCKTANGIGIGSVKLGIIAAYEDYSIDLQPGYAHYYETETGKGKSTISIFDGTGVYTMRFYLMNNKVVSFELKAYIWDWTGEESGDEK